MRALTRLAILAPLVLVAACGSDGDSSDPVETVTGEASGPADTSAATADDQADAPAGSAGGATLTLANGERFEFPTVLCTLEPQMAAGSEILFTATSYDDPGLDITQFGDEGTITGVASISVYDGNFDILWQADSMLGSSVDLTLDGSTIRGTASFVQGDDFGGETVDGEVVANC